jgi:hypothetical protein
MALQKAKLYNADTGAEVVQFHFNPNEFTVNQSNQWQPQQTSGSSIPDVRFGGVGARTLSMTIVFDTYEQKTDVRAHTDKVQKLMEVPAAQGPTGKQSRPPHVEFGWGTFRSFRSVITQVSQRFTLFLPDGTPVRATLQLTLQEVPRESAEGSARGQNPTSVAAGARRVRVVRAGDTIDHIAAEEFGDPTVWRVIAEANGIDDPRRLRPGQTLLIPPEL